MKYEMKYFKLYNLFVRLIEFNARLCDAFA